MITVGDAIKRLEKLEEEFEKEFLERVKQRTPVSKQDKGDVGRLQKGWSWEDDGKDGKRVFTNEAPYAIFVEQGTRYMSPTLMVGTTILESEDILKKALEKVGL